MDEQEIFNLIKTFDVKRCMKYVKNLFIDNKEKTAKVINNHAIDLYQDFPKFFHDIIYESYDCGYIDIDEIIVFILLLDNMTLQLSLINKIHDIMIDEELIELYNSLFQKLLLQNSELKTQISIDEVKILVYKQKYEQLQLEVALKPSCEVCKNDGGRLFKEARNEYSYLIKKFDKNYNSIN